MAESSLSQAFHLWEQEWEQKFEALEQRIQALEQQGSSSQAENATIDPAPAPTPAPTPSPSLPSPPAQQRQGVILKFEPKVAKEAGLPVDRQQFLRWLVDEHGARIGAAKRVWREAPAYYEALLHIRATAKARSQLHPCGNPRCPCKLINFSAPSAEAQPPVTQKEMASWLAQHGANEGTANSADWRRMPLDDKKRALMFAESKIYGSRPSAAAARNRGVSLHRCQDLACPCQEMLGS